MCGICGTAGFGDTTVIRRMLDVMRHRGPDDLGVQVFASAGIALGNCRLSIIDLSPSGHMPMSNEDGTVWVSFNGEIVNFQGLRTELEAKGHLFRSRTDTEVLVHGYEEWGIELLPRLNGMFAIALVDTARAGPARVLLARDRLGIKPLYFSVIGRRLLFASEIKALFLAGELQPRVRLEALHRYLTFLWVPGPETMFDGVQKLPPGHYLLWEDGRLQEAPYWDLEFRPKAADERELLDELRTVLRDSVRRHLISDVPVGIFLSGGLDSSAIAALVRETNGGRVRTYTIAYREADGRGEPSAADGKFARMVARRLGTEHTEIVVQPDVVRLLPKITWHLDEPVADAAAIATYLISEAARPHVKVLLSGQGGDEVFAGYPVHRMHALANALNTLPDPARRWGIPIALGLLGRLKKGVPGIHPGLLLAGDRFLRRLVAGTELPPEARYIFYRSYYQESDQRALYTSDLNTALADCVAGERHLEYFGRVNGDDFVNRMLYVDLKTFLPELNLTYSDKLSSAASVEVRVPLLDAELVEFMAQVPSDLKLHGLRPKYILRKALRDLLPRAVIRRRKAGFGAPVRTWLRGDLNEMVGDLLSESVLRRRAYFEPAAVRRMIEEDRCGKRDNSQRIWALLTLELWHRSFIDARGSAAPGCGVHGA